MMVYAWEKSVSTMIMVLLLGEKERLQIVPDF